jgi:hypothetical protein
VVRRDAPAERVHSNRRSETDGQAQAARADERLHLQAGLFVWPLVLESKLPAPLEVVFIDLRLQLVLLVPAVETTRFLAPASDRDHAPRHQAAGSREAPECRPNLGRLRASAPGILVDKSVGSHRRGQCHQARRAPKQAGARPDKAAAPVKGSHRRPVGEGSPARGRERRRVVGCAHCVPGASRRQARPRACACGRRAPRSWSPGRPEPRCRRTMGSGPRSDL